MYYLAYGSNMCTNRLRARVPSCRFHGVADLVGYSLRFHKRSVDGSGKGDAFYTGNPEDKVSGVGFEISDREKPRLDNAEGLGNGYHEQRVNLDAAGSAVEAVMYVADNDAIDSSLQPYTWYKAFVVEGAKQHGLSQDYITSIEAITALADPNPERENRNRRVLPC